MSPEKTIKLPGVLTVQQLADALNQPVTSVIAKLMGFGVLATINEDIDYDTAAIIADDYGILVEREQESDDVTPVKPTENTKDLQVRPAIVTIMGHVDHGKTSLLDTIRKTNVAASEAGGITQAISSYQIEISPKKKGEKRIVTFLDTPGHSAFEAMRRHGVKITDLVVLVVAADDGVKPQTIEAINHARQLGVPVMVAINKMDKPDADIDRVKAELAEHDLAPEDWGGKTITVPVSAKAGTGIDDLLEMILLSTDIRELKANYHVPAVGVVVESQLKPGVGPVATVIIQNGTLKVGDYVAIGSVSGKVRTIINHLGKKLLEATPSMPVAISGLSTVPIFGEQLAVFGSEKDAKEAARQHVRTMGAKRASSALNRGLSVATQKEGNRIIMNVLVKADTIGSLEAIRSGLERMKNDDLEVRIVADGVGDLSEGDITMAKTTHALVLGFNVRFPALIKSLADREKVHVSLYNVVYELFGDVREALVELMPMEEIELVCGELKILARFRDNRSNVVLGGQVQEGVAEPNRNVRIMRGAKLIGEGKVLGVRRGHESSKAVETGSECGLELDLKSGQDEVKVGDRVEFIKIEKQRKNLGL